MKKTILTAFIAIMAMGHSLYAQNVGINTSYPDASAVLDVYSEKLGILIPRMNTPNRLAIPQPARSLLVYDTDSSCFYYFDGQNWQSLHSSADSLWTRKGNVIYNRSDRVGIGTDSALALLHLNSDTSSTYMLFSTAYFNSIIGLDETDGTIVVGRDSSGNIKKQLVIDTLGRVGIGTVRPEQTLHLAQDTGNVGVKMETPLYNVIIGLDETDGTIFVNGDTVRRLQIDTAGRVGIGSIDADSKLNVDGRIKTNELELHGPNGNYVITLDDQGMPDISKSTNNYLDIYGTAAQTFNNAFENMAWGGTRWAPPTGSACRHTVGGNEVEILREGLYKITYNLSYEGTLLLDAEIETQLHHKPASGSFAAIPGATTYSSVGLNLSSNRSSVTKTIIIPLGQGDVVKLLARRSAGGGTITTLPDGCSLTIERL